MEDLFFHIATKLHYGIDTVQHLGITVKDIGSRIMLVYDPVLENSPILAKVVSSLENAGISPLFFDECGSFSTSRSIEKGIGLADKGQVQCVVGLGGVTTLSSAKVIAGLMRTQPRLDPVFGKYEVESEPLPFVGLPVSFRDPFMFTPRALLVDARNRMSRIVTMKGFSAHSIIIDPRLSMDLGDGMMKSIAVELLVQAMEGYFSTASNFITHSLFLRSIDMVFEGIRLMVEGKRDDEVVSKCCQAGLLCGLGFSMGRLGIATSVAYAAHGLRQVPSGSVAAIMLPYLLEYAKHACPDKLRRIGPIVNAKTESPGNGETVDAIVDSVRGTVGSLDLPMRLSQCEIFQHHLPLIASAAVDMGVMGTLPSPLTLDEVLAMLKQAL